MRLTLKIFWLLALVALANGCAAPADYRNPNSTRSLIQSPADSSGTKIDGYISTGGSYRLK